MHKTTHDVVQIQHFVQIHHNALTQGLLNPRWFEETYKSRRNFQKNILAMPRYRYRGLPLASFTMLKIAR